MSNLSFKDRVVIITGAGGGLGRAYALEYAQRGAKVVVNDLGGSLQGSGGSTRAADAVVDEIKRLGGEAVPNYDSVTDGDKIVKTAIDAFGRVDIIVNNAGILRDVSFARMTLADFNSVVEVHLTGAYKVCKAAWPYMRQQRFGRIVNTASPAGLYGNFGQANYCAAKSGLIGLGKTLAREGAKYNINVNVIAPLARSRMTDGLLPAHISKAMGPEKVSPIVLYLTHEDTKVTNSIFEPAAGYYGQVRWERSSGELFNPSPETFTPEAIFRKFSSILEFKDKPFKAVEHPVEHVDYNTLISKARKLPPNEQGALKITSLKNKVVVITGAGAGLGRSHAFWFAKYGARVVVNDLKGAEAVTDEINKKYGAGRAVADSHNVVTESNQIIETALGKFGRIDVLVNNAGILRDRSFLKMTDEEWKSVLDVHLTSTFLLCKAVWPIFLKQNSGVIFNTTSTSGIYGRFGQANYAAAKCAVLGFSRNLAIEGAKKGIRVYPIAPHASTSMTQTTLTDVELKNYDPSQVSPLYVLLASDEFAKKFKFTNGFLFEIGAGWIGHTRLQRSNGAVSATVATPEWIKDNWNKISNFSKPSYPRNVDEATGEIFTAVMAAISMSNPSGKVEYKERDVILYNLGLGCTAKQTQYTYENDPRFAPLPTYGIVVAMNGGNINFSESFEKFDFTMLLHGEQYIKLFRPTLPPAATMQVNTKVVAVANKGNNAGIIVVGYEVVDQSTKQTMCYSEGTYFVRGAKVAPGRALMNPRPEFATQKFNAPERQPDFEQDVSTHVDSAAIYRLSGDYNPLHIDSKVAAFARFPKPILHGMCTLGYSVKLLTEKFGPIEEIKTRLSDFVFPGDVLRVRAWKEPNGVIIFQTYDVSREKVVLSNSAIKIAGSSAKL